MEIKNVILCGLGALGMTYACKLNQICKLKILANKERIEKYKLNPPLFNNKKMNFEYITPNENWDADLVIISTKANGLDSAIEYIKNFVSEKTLIISLINGITSEVRLAEKYGWEKVLRSYYIGHSAIRIDNNITQDGIGKIIIEPNKDIESFFKNNNIDYEVSNNIIYSQWLKLGVNIILNEPSAIYEMKVGDLLKVKEYLPLAKNLLKEIKEVANLYGLENLENYENEVLESIKLISGNGTTSMYQDIISKRKTEIDIFSGEILRLAKKFNIETPYNQEMYDKIKNKEKNFS